MPTLEQLSLGLVNHWKAVRLRALQDTPSAFGSTYQQESQLSHDDWLKRAATWNGPDSVCYIVMDAGEPCGILACFLDKENPRTAHVVSMWVAPAHRRSGLATTLMGAVQEWARNQGAAELRLMVTSNNAAAKFFYQKRGFVFTGVAEPYANDPALVEYEMVKPIALFG